MLDLGALVWETGVEPWAVCMLSMCSTALALREECLTQAEAAKSFSPAAALLGALINATAILMTLTE